MEQRTRLTGYVDDMIRFVEVEQLLDAGVWRRFVDQFRAEDADGDGGWRGEYWGKMMRGAALTYAYTGNAELYEVLTETVEDLLSTERADGRISSYAAGHERQHWDLWCRKYVLIGLQYYLEICRDAELGERIVASMLRQVAALVRFVGDGKQAITEASGMYRGLNSSSILEPVVRLYQRTGDEAVLGLARHIVEQGGTSVANVFRLAYEDGLKPYQYPVTKAYELMSCFQGLLAYYEVSGEAWQREAVVRFADAVLETDFTIIGSSGCSHEFLDHSTHTQTDVTEQPLMQETCVTVTVMNFFYHMTLLTGDMKYVDAFERAMYNAYFGAINTEGEVCSVLSEAFPAVHAEALPFDSYSPLTEGRRGRFVGGLKVMSDDHHYGCCACIGAAGGGLIPQMALMRDASGPRVQLYVPGILATTTPKGQSIQIEVITEYPVCGEVKMVVHVSEPERFQLSFRNPIWSMVTTLTVNGECYQDELPIMVVDRLWSDGDVVVLNLDMTTRAVLPVEYREDVLMTRVIWELDYIVPEYREQDPSAMRRRAVIRGPITFAFDSALGWEPDEPVELVIREDFSIAAEVSEKAPPFKCQVMIDVPLKDGSRLTLVDYGSAGKRWEDQVIAAWPLVM